MHTKSHHSDWTPALNSFGTKVLNLEDSILSKRSKINEMTNLKQSTWKVHNERQPSTYPAPAFLHCMAPSLFTPEFVFPLQGCIHSTHEMATMATITKPAIPVVSNGSLRSRGNCKHSWVSCRRGQFVVRASDDVGSSGSAVGQTPTSPIESPGNSVKALKPSPLQKGGTLEGDEAAGKDLPAPSKASAVTDAGKFDDPRWRAGTWDITKFTSNGKINWDAVIDAEVARRKWLEENPEASNNSEPVVFDTAMVPWWAWVKRFHLPEAELLNGRAAMVGYAVGYIVDSATGVGLVDQQNTFLGKTLLFLTVLGVLLIRKNSDVANLRIIAKESTFYDKQWQATWKDEDSDKEKDPSDIS